jgi:hypothetical protein
VRYAEFEEKEYESPLYNELVCGTKNLWTPGQVLEHHFGFDAMLDVVLDPIWVTLGYRVHPTGVTADQLNWGFIWRKLGHRRRLPRFQANAFIQAKRPQILRRRQPKLKAKGIGSPYWRFLTTTHQQDALEAVAKRLANRAVVLYASAAFGTLDELFKYSEDGKIAQNSSFIAADRLAGHQSWNYDQPGTSGVACSDPERIDAPSFSETIASLVDPAESTEEPNADGALRSLEFVVNELLQALSELEAPGPRTRLFLRMLRDRLPLEGEPTLARRAARAVKQIQLFSALHSAPWYVVG